MERNLFTLKDAQRWMDENASKFRELVKSDHQLETDANGQKKPTSRKRKKPNSWEPAAEPKKAKAQKRVVKKVDPKNTAKIKKLLKQPSSPGQMGYENALVSNCKEQQLFQQSQMNNEGPQPLSFVEELVLSCKQKGIAVPTQGLKNAEIKDNLNKVGRLKSSMPVVIHERPKIDIIDPPRGVPPPAAAASQPSTLAEAPLTAASQPSTLPEAPQPAAPQPSTSTAAPAQAAEPQQSPTVPPEPQAIAASSKKPLTLLSRNNKDEESDDGSISIESNSSASSRNGSDTESLSSEASGEETGDGEEEETEDGDEDDAQKELHNTGFLEDTQDLETEDLETRLTKSLKNFFTKLIREEAKKSRKEMKGSVRKEVRRAIRKIKKETRNTRETSTSGPSFSGNYSEGSSTGATPSNAEIPRAFLDEREVTLVGDKTDFGLQIKSTQAAKLLNGLLARNPKALRQFVSWFLNYWEPTPH